MARFNDLSVDDAEDRLYACFANRTWAAHVAAARPHADVASLLASAESAWGQLDRRDWVTAFGAHPRIGERGGQSSQASEHEQSGVRRGSDETLAALAAENREYEDRFGHVFLIAASGRTAGEVLGELRRRMKNDPETEMQVAADEHRKITRMRLETMLGI